MSDFEDEMDIDVPVSKDVTFNAGTKGKRSAANLPVEAEDSLPWYDWCFSQYAKIDVRN